MLDAYIYDGLRSPFGRYVGALATVRADDLVATVMKALVEKHQLSADIFDEVLLGSANQAGEDSRNIARNAALLAGLDVTTPGQTVNRLCASGLSTVVDAARSITCNEGDIILAGGVESMTRAPFVFAKTEQPFSRDFKVFDTTIGSRFPNPKIIEQFGSDTMPQTGDNVAQKYGITREEADKFAAASQAKYQAAKQAGFFDDEITPITVSQGKKLPAKVVIDDEHPRASSNIEALQKLKPLNQDGVVTAGNASGINDGAAALIIGSKQAEKKLGFKPIAKILSSGAMGVEPNIMGVGPVEAIKLALKRADLTLEDMSVIEINEAFASQVLGCLKGLDIDFDDKRVNPNGGAIAVGHPLGASGARIALSTARELQRTGGKYAVVSLCIGIGQGLAMVIERV
ncbi:MULTISPECIES: 3-oxoadipyl-CoA thiolase [Psychrobacter]|uniref:3-oxoadipyl-CoA thiolase n=1 Tax=Psychrobacter TaxID=497 RepID=UPI00086932EA|nr:MULTISPECIES: 3-oxoadipyl-CoA thiolase [Psychrobacter]MBA6245223.1 3-oxoadipyl-CoA thiolase [Psychrobacter sp. Urea-trap-18]MBA6285624.1 3-oxoadipyl-CoA thiolase [Psychrobacter sp. Urea-trap-16]MBA6318871.1 3-oxoadipyl-CoA thiolase [Psychrobacter sp. Urea-trap-20]MBA6333988.1 3-oxoadipyl-CoA thiolase [Psychrobacter sp. Urea-trap-19]OEH68852.1 MAG: beta-ketoadipyl CoA thiolase [Psychrobacter sp. B29-1]|tara:strand:- start:720 stop:1922 length:1203 start_codon:yes stop_codon:yes gene_type:complete